MRFKGEKLYMKETEREARRWFLQARDDARFVAWVDKEGSFFDKGCFIAQQSGEKALKACLYARGERRVFGHSLFEMATELLRTDEIFRSITDEARRLDRFYIPTRYPNGLPGGTPFEVYTQKDLQEAGQDLDRVLKACARFLETQGVHFE
jgi:HEPN domain-containing protein